MAGVWAAYNRALASNPLLVKAATSFTGFTVGDILAQKFINKGEEYDFARTLRLGSFGALIHGPTGHWFYGILDKKLPGTAAMTVATKVAIDQTIWNPIFGVMFFTYLGLTEGKSFDQIGKKIRADLKTAVVGSWSVWIPAHTINFRFVPPAQRLLYINSIQIGYNVFLSFLGNKSAEDTTIQDTVSQEARELDYKLDSASNEAHAKAQQFGQEAHEQADRAGDKLDRASYKASTKAQEFGQSINEKADRAGDKLDRASVKAHAQAQDVADRASKQ